MASIPRSLMLLGLLGTVTGVLTSQGLKSETLVIHESGIPDSDFHHSPSISAEWVWVEHSLQHGRLRFPLLPHSDDETLLFLTVQDVPQRSADVTVTVEELHTPCPLGQWHDGIEFPERPPYPPLPETSHFAVDRQQDVSEDQIERWFLPSSRKSSSINTRCEPITTRTIFKSDRVRLVMDQTIACDPQRLIWCRNFAVRLNQVLIPRVEAVFGPVADRLSDGTLTVVITPQVRAVGGSDSTIDAFVLATDFRIDLDQPDGNGCDAIYVHPDLEENRRDAILVHELTHAAQFCAFRRHYGGRPWPLQDWMIEGTAHAAEVLLTHNRTNVADRLRAFAWSPEQSPLVIVDASVCGRWRDPRCRGAACAFFTWAAERFGLETITALIVSSATVDDPWFVATGRNWPEIQRAWLASVATARETRRHTLAMGQSITIKIDGGATAFIRLPRSTIPMTVSATGRSDLAGRVTVLRHAGNISTNDEPQRVAAGLTVASGPASLRP